MSKLFNKTVKKTTLWSVIIAIVLAAAIVICALFGFNKNLEMKDRKTLTVSLNAYVYTTQLDTVKEELGNTLGAEYVIEGAMSGDVSEIVFVFESSADLAALKTSAENYLAGKVANAPGWNGATYSVSVSVEDATAALAKGYVVRMAIAGAVLAVLAFAYVALRYNLAGGIATAVSVLLGMLLTTSLIVLSRVYVNASVAYAVSIAGLLTAMMTLFTLNNVRSAQKDGVSEEETVASAVAVEEVLYTAIVVAVGMTAVGILGKTTGIWFAVSALIAVLVSALVSLFFAPAAYLSLKTVLGNKPAKGAYVGAKKGAVKAKKAPKAKAEKVEKIPAEVAEEAPAEEAAIEEVEEAPAEEAATEEVEEAPAEVAATEEVEEAPVVEVAAEVVEENPAEEVIVEAVEEAPAEETPVEVAEVAEVAEEKTEE